MAELVRFTECADGGKRAQKHADTYLIDPDHVGLVAPRATYTSLLVQGRWIHVAHPYEEVLNMLGKES